MIKWLKNLFARVEPEEPKLKITTKEVVKYIVREAKALAKKGKFAAGKLSDRIDLFKFRLHDAANAHISKEATLVLKELGFRDVYVSQSDYVEIKWYEKKTENGVDKCHQLNDNSLADKIYTIALKAWQKQYHAEASKIKNITQSILKNENKESNDSD